MSDRLLILWIALLGASRIDLLAGAGPFVLTPFLALSPVLVGWELWRIAGEGWRPRIPGGAASYLLTVSALLVLLLVSTFLAYEVTTSAQRFALLLVHVYPAFLLAVALADRPEPARVLLRGAVWGIAVVAGFSALQLVAWLTGYAGPEALRGVVDLEPATYFGIIPRLTGASHDPNLGGFLVLFYLALISIHAPPSRGRARLLRLGALLVVLTLSRSAILAALALWGLTKLRGSELRIGPRAIAGATAAAAAAAILLVASPGTVGPVLDVAGMLGERVSPEEGSAVERFQLVGRAWEVGTDSIEHIFFGIGYGNAHVVLQDFFPGHPYANFHALFATLFAESGAAAALLAAWLFLQAYLRGGVHRPLVGALLVFNLFQQAHTEPWFWLALSLAWMGVGRWPEEETAAAGEPEATRVDAPVGAG